MLQLSLRYAVLGRGCARVLYVFLQCRFPLRDPYPHGVRGPRFESHVATVTAICSLGQGLRTRTVRLPAVPLPFAGSLPPWCERTKVRVSCCNCHCDMQSWAGAAHLYCSSQVNSALHPSGVAKCRGGNVTSVGWQVTLCDPIIWHVSSRSGVAFYIANCYIRILYFYFNYVYKTGYSFSLF